MLEDLKDEALVALCRAGDVRAEEVLISRYSPYVRSIARPYFLAGADSEDLIQEGMIGVIKAVLEFREEHHTRFRTFAAYCIRNRIFSAIRKSLRGKNSPLNNYVSLETYFKNDKAESQGMIDPAEQVIGDEAYVELLSAVSELLSPLEREILSFYLQGLSYGEISEHIKKPEKSVENAVQRIRRKFASYLTSRGDIRR